MAARPSWATPISKALTARFIRTSARMRPGCGNFSFNFRFPEEFPATLRRRRRVPFTKAVNWAIRSAIRLGRCSTILISSSPASSATARRKPARWPRHGIPTSFSIRPPTARCCRSCISTVTRFPIRPSSRASPARNWSSCSAATGGHPSLSKVMSLR